MVDAGEKHFREWLNVIINGLILLVMIATLVIAWIQVFPFLSEKVEIQVRQENGYKANWSSAGSSEAPDSKEWVILSIPFEVRAINVGKTDIVLRQCAITLAGEERLPSDCAYEFAEETLVQEYFESAFDDTPERFPIHLASGSSRTFVAWLRISIVGAPGKRVWDALAGYAPEALRCDLVRWPVEAALLPCGVGLKLHAAITTGERATFSSSIIEWNRPFISCADES
jgi:hypothetical protein